MSRPRFLADHDFNENIIDGLLRREPSVEISRARDHDLQEQPDAAVLEFAAVNRLLVLSHDVNTMTAAAYARINANLDMPGILIVRQTQPLAAIIDDLFLIWSTSEAEEWARQVWFLPI
jgi:hypothetical protein